MRFVAWLKRTHWGQWLKRQAWARQVYARLSGVHPARPIDDADVRLAAADRLLHSGEVDGALREYESVLSAITTSGAGDARAMLARPALPAAVRSHALVTGIPDQVVEAPPRPAV